MKTASQLIRNFIFSPDQHPGNGTPEFEAVCQDARDFLAMEQEVQEARALVKLNQFDEARRKLDELTAKHGVTEPILAAKQYVSRVHEAHKNLKLEALFKEALELAAMDDTDFNNAPRGITEIAKEAASL